MIKKNIKRSIFKISPTIFFIKAIVFIFLYFMSILYYKLNIFLLIKNYKKNILDLKN